MAHIPHSEYNPDEPQLMELTVTPTRDDYGRWTIQDALAVLKAAEEAAQDD